MASVTVPSATKRRRTTVYGVLGTLVFVGLLFLVLDCPLVTMSIMGGPYKKVLAQVGTCEPARELLGDDVRLRNFGPSYGSSSGERGSFRIPVAGSKQLGTLDYSWGDELEWTLFVGGEFTRNGFTGTTLKSADCEKPTEDDSKEKAPKAGKSKPSSSSPQPSKDESNPEPPKDEPSAEPPKEEPPKVDPPKDEPTKDVPIKDVPIKPVPSTKKKKPGK